MRPRGFIDVSSPRLWACHRSETVPCDASNLDHRSIRPFADQVRRNEPRRSVNLTNFVSEEIAIVIMGSNREISLCPSQDLH